ncbi:hypothetical protein D3C87_1523830 [compost metagenome]
MAGGAGGDVPVVLLPGYAKPVAGKPFGEVRLHRLIQVGASLLAMDVNDNACLPVKRGALASFASKARSYISLNAFRPRCTAGLASTESNQRDSCGSCFQSSRSRNAVAMVNAEMSAMENCSPAMKPAVRKLSA